MTTLNGNGTPSRGDPTPHRLIYDKRPDGQPRFQGCSKISAYQILSKLGEGTFGEVHKAKHVWDNHLVALKKILMHNEKDGFPITALREIKLLKMLSHRNVLKLEEMAVERRGEGKKKAFMYMVTPYMDHDLSGLLENPSVQMTEAQIKCYMLQLLEGVRYLHAQKILHRDMKAANLLINNRGILQIADFGLARPYDEDPPQRGKGGGIAHRDYTTLVVTRWYRPPELLLQLRKYTSSIDMWGVGCVFGEMFKRRPILAGKSDLNQLQRIFELVGSPTDQNMPGWDELPGFKKDGISSYGLSKGHLSQEFRDQSPLMISLLSSLLTLDWRKRINAIDALEHPYFTSNPMPLQPHEIPQFEESHELDRRKFRDQQAALPPAPAGGTVGMGPRVDDWSNVSHGNGYPIRKPQIQPSHPLTHQHPTPHRDRDRDNYDRRQQTYPNRGPPPPPQSSSEAHKDRRPGWERNRGPNLDLPPRPPVDANWHQLDGDGQGGNSRRRHEPYQPRHNGPPPHSTANVDTYIPNYEQGSVDRPPRSDRSRGWERNASLPYDEPSQRRSRSPNRDRRERVRDDYRR